MCEFSCGWSTLLRPAVGKGARASIELRCPRCYWRFILETPFARRPKGSKPAPLGGHRQFAVTIARRAFRPVFFHPVARYKKKKKNEKRKKDKSRAPAVHAAVHSYTHSNEHTQNQMLSTVTAAETRLLRKYSHVGWTRTYAKDIWGVVIKLSFLRARQRTTPINLIC